MLKFFKTTQKSYSHLNFPAVQEHRLIVISEISFSSSIY